MRSHIISSQILALNRARYHVQQIARTSYSRHRLDGASMKYGSFQRSDKILASDRMCARTIIKRFSVALEVHRAQHLDQQIARFLMSYPTSL